MPQLQPGDLFAGHRVLRHIADGHVGEVYEAAAPGGARVALKRLRQDAAYTLKREERLALEADVLASTEHVNLVRLHDVLSEDGHVALVLELVRGPNLRRLADACPGKRLPLVRAVGILRQACEAVAAIHALEIVHRDLRPENILVGEGDLVKVSDLGSARLARLDMATTLQLGLASVLYAPPEWMGPTQAVHPAIDVYAMAVLAYELLAGVHPIATEDMNAFVVCAAHASVVPPPLSALLRDLPEGLSDLLQRGMSKDPAARPSMREVADTLGRIHHRLLAPLRARARAVPLPNRPLALARTEPAMPAHPGGGTLVLPIAPASAAPVSAREVLLPAPPSVAPSTKRSASDPGAPSGVLAASEATPAAGDRRSTAVPVEGAVPRPSRPSRALPVAVAALGVVLSLNLAGAAWFVVLRPRAPAEAAPASPGSASAVPAAGTGSLADAAAPAGSTAAAPAASSAAAPPPSAVPAAKPSAASVPAAPVASAPRRKASAAPVHKAPPSLGELPDHL